MIREVELTPEQGQTLASGAPIAYFPHDERVRVEPGSVLVLHESAVPKLPPAA